MKSSLCFASLLQVMKMMMMMMKLWNLLFLFCFLNPEAEGHISLPMNHTVVVELDSMSSKVTNVSLHCGEAFKDLEVYWEKKNLRRGTGVQLNIKVEDFLHGGNYTCHRKDNKEVLNYTMVLVHKTRDSQGDYPKTILQKLSEKSYIKCESNSHCGKFECSWNFDVNSRGVELLASAHRSSGSSMDGSIQCTISTKEKNKAICEEVRFCPYREESDQVTFVLHIIHGTQLEEYVEKFFLSDIVKPDKPQDIEKKNASTVVWKYPSTWNHSSTFFPLYFEAKAIKGGKNCDDENGQKRRKESSTSVFTEDLHFSSRCSKCTVCIRAKDRFHNSSWSEWSSVNM
ncbi:interleukin 12Ba [Erpetoichthys calabaricus]|uniref:interleukin 12Ba n=1 Tax=Erpetoichthys calabaricus TaxID=27687 RepID=UPI00223475A8|nr:interleukin 12Ba [Erpetoichthys calabaricus]